MLGVLGTGNASRGPTSLPGEDFPPPSGLHRRARRDVKRVHGNEKVPVCGRFQVPAGGRLKVPIPRVSSGVSGPGR